MTERIKARPRGHFHPATQGIVLALTSPAAMTPFDRGWQSGNDGKGRFADNPYLDGTQAHQDWHAGFHRGLSSYVEMQLQRRAVGF